MCFAVSTVAPTTQRQVAILDAARRVVVREGAHGLRMAAVAREARVSKALVHYYFTTRQELLRSAFSWSEEQWRAGLAAKLASLPTGAQRLEQALLLTVEATEPSAGHRALWNEVWSSLRFDDELRPLVDASYRDWLDQLVLVIREGRKDGSIPASVEPRQSAWRLAALGDGIDSMLYLQLLSREKARSLIREGIRRELTG